MCERVGACEMADGDQSGQQHGKLSVVYVLPRRGDSMAMPFQAKSTGTLHNASGRQDDRATPMGCKPSRRAAGTCPDAMSRRWKQTVPAKRPAVAGTTMAMRATSKRKMGGSRSPPRGRMRRARAAHMQPPRGRGGADGFDLDVLLAVAVQRRWPVSRARGVAAVGWTGAWRRHSASLGG